MYPCVQRYDLFSTYHLGNWSLKYFKILNYPYHQYFVFTLLQNKASEWVTTTNIHQYLPFLPTTNFTTPFPLFSTYTHTPFFSTYYPHTYFNPPPIFIVRWTNLLAAQSILFFTSFYLYFHTSLVSFWPPIQPYLTLDIVKIIMNQQVVFYTWTTWTITHAVQSTQITHTHVSSLHHVITAQLRDTTWWMRYSKRIGGRN